MVDMAPPLDIEPLRFLLTFDDVLAELGGVVAVSKLTTRSPSAVCNWRNSGERFPASLFPKMRKALRKRGCTPDLRLFTFLFDDDELDYPIVDLAA
jgi:hypothetical protein